MGRFVLAALLAMSFLAAGGPKVRLHTNRGDIVVQLDPKIAPLATENFVKLVQKGYYDGTIFHRVIRGFMIQGGDPTGTGRGGTSIWGKPFKDEFAPNVVFDRPYLLAMANRGPNTNGSQFFITVAPAPWLNGGYTIFGKVIAGKKVVDAINRTPVGPGNRPLKKQVILKATLEK
ncbi:peptidylprolyl isomerase [Nitratifractor sp.]